MKNQKQNKASSRFENLPLISGVLKWSKNHTLPGFKGMQVFDVVKLALKESADKDIFTRSYGVAYSAFLSLFPFIIVIFSVISLFPRQNVISYVERSIHGIMPLNAERFLLDTVETIIQIPRSGLLSLGFVLALYFSNRAMMTMMRGFDKSYYESTFKNRSFLRKIFVATAITILIGFLLILTLGLIIVGDTIISEFVIFKEHQTVLSAVLFATKWILVILTFLLMMGIIYRFGPAMREKIRVFSPGSVLSTVFCILTSVGFSIFVNNFGTYNKVYGSIGATIVVMIWIQINCLIILFGYELNAAIAILKSSRGQD